MTDDNAQWLKVLAVHLILEFLTREGVSLAHDEENNGGCEQSSHGNACQNDASNRSPRETYIEIEKMVDGIKLK